MLYCHGRRNNNNQEFTRAPKWLNCQPGDCGFFNGIWPICYFWLFIQNEHSQRHLIFLPQRVSTCMIHPWDQPKQPKIAELQRTVKANVEAKLMPRYFPGKLMLCKQNFNQFLLEFGTMIINKKLENIQVWWTDLSAKEWNIYQHNELKNIQICWKHTNLLDIF